MSTTSLVAEFLVIGFFPFLSAVFFILHGFKIYDLSFVARAESVMPVVVIVSTITIYIIGAIFHRITQVFNTNTFSFLMKIKPVHKIMGQKDPTDQEKWWRDYCLVYESGSVNLIRRLEYEESLVRIFRSTIITAPLLGAALWFWLNGTVYYRGAWISVLLSLLFCFMALTAYTIQRKSMRLKFQLATEIIAEKNLLDKTEKKKRKSASKLK